jgi:hypothetical protein
MPKKQTAAAPEVEAPNVLEGLKQLYHNDLKPVEEEYLFPSESRGCKKWQPDRLQGYNVSLRLSMKAGRALALRLAFYFNNMYTVGSTVFACRLPQPSAAGC